MIPYVKCSLVMGMLTASLFAAVETDKSDFTASFTTYFGRDLSPEAPSTSFSFEPLLSYKVQPKTTLGITSWIDRPTDPYKNFEVPKTIASVNQEIALVDGLTTNTILSANAINLHRWIHDGRMLRTALGLQAKKEVLTDFTVLFRITPYVQFNEFKQSTSGKDLTQYGISERLGLILNISKLELDATFIFDQKYSSNWYNDYYFSQGASYNFTDQISAGISHQLLSSVIDETTGYSRGLSLFDERKSRLSVSLKVSL